MSTVTDADRLASQLEYQMELARMLKLAAACAQMTAQLVIARLVKS